ncbi:hypothetical protein AB0395_21660 [Streptosporangium sp. NPDC051023]|uniref:hypothetical protein n=1 Tax=Streptosporangium sp. NPDC051023 TaxID=3155410 RepID=UPI00344EB833
MAERKSKGQEADSSAETATATTSGETAEPSDVAQSSAAPIDPPLTARQMQQQPLHGHPDSTTNAVSASNALRSVPGSAHEGLVDENEQPLDIEDVFVFPEAGDPSTFATVKVRVFERFKYPNASQVTSHLLYPAGAQVPVWQARKVVDKYRELQAEQTIS